MSHQLFFLGMEDGHETWTLGDVLMVNVHHRHLCEGRPCIMHAPTLNPMSGFRLHFRSDRGIFERLCPHGVGHPDLDQVAYWHEMMARGYEEYGAQGIHGCDGCCLGMDSSDDYADYPPLPGGSS